MTVDDTGLMAMATAARPCWPWLFNMRCLFIVEVVAEAVGVRPMRYSRLSVGEVRKAAG